MNVIATDMAFQPLHSLSDRFAKTLGLLSESEQC